MVSTCSSDTAVIHNNGTAHQFKINYSKTNSTGIGHRVTTPTFESGGYKWCINFYPNGCLNNCYASLFLELLEDHMGLNASFTLGILEGEGSQEVRVLLKRFNHTFRNLGQDWGNPCFIKRSDLEERYVINGVFVILCMVNVEDNLRMSKKVGAECSCGAMADAEFEVEGEVFSAHRHIIGARSPLFKAKLFGSKDCVKIRDVKPKVFRALLNFIYTCSLPDDVDSDLIEHLLLAADRYAIEELVIRCEEWLIEKISLGTVLDFLIFADQHNFSKLKDACLEMVSQPENFVEVARTKEYCVMILEVPSLLADLRERILG
ncbi:hypothetical protein LUZ60_012653 [Juncus effusus]|nr:hypothetical protein LUZ60_012653 [Juncus effusus]